MIPSDARRDSMLLTVARTLRGAAAGALAVVFATDLAAAGYGPFWVGVIVGVAVGASAAWAILIAHRIPRLAPTGLFVLGALTVAIGGFLLWFDLASPWALVPAILLGGIVAGGSDISPLAAVEQGSLSRAVTDRTRTGAFVAYNLAGYVGTAVGALLAVPLSGIGGNLAGLPSSPRDGVLLLYGLVGLALLPTYLLLRSSRAPTGPDPGTHRPLSPEHRGPIVRLSALFAVDAFGGGMTTNTLVAYFLVLRFGAPPAAIGTLLALASVAAGASLLLALPLARRIGLVRTMVFTHIPSSLLLIAFAFAPALLGAGVLWVARSTLSQMDVPTRQSYTQAIVPRSEGIAAAGYTTAARSSQALGSPVTGAFFAVGGPWLAGPFALAGSIKVAYDLALFRSFRAHRPPEETEPPPPPGPGGRHGPP
ncbi:MAG: MFS transporter [Thermoplasmata archaeon]